jgi:hypothetical protein
MSASTYLSSDDKAATRLFRLVLDPKGLCADSEEKRGPVSDINAVEEANGTDWRLRASAHSIPANVPA